MEPGERSSLEDTIIEKISSSPYIQGELHTHICHKEYPCTNNENGIFLNVTALSDEHLIEINNVITHIEEYNQTFVDKELQLKELLRSQFLYFYLVCLTLRAIADQILLKR